jgi:hypothetical protein
MPPATTMPETTAGVDVNQDLDPTEHAGLRNDKKAHCESIGIARLPRDEKSRV